MRDFDVTHFFLEVKNMENYKSFYHAMFNKVTDVIEELQKLQQEMEEKYISFCEEEAKNNVNTELIV